LGLTTVIQFRKWKYLKMKQILVAVDGSKHSLGLADRECELAKAMSFKIVLVHVMPKITQEPEGIAALGKSENFPVVYSEYIQELGERVTGKLTEKTDKAGISCTTMTPSGNPADEILNLADAKNVATLVVGVKGLHGVSRIKSLGSVSRRIIENSTRPVLVVP
jgi:nucleotide-binding universal stress UspA family protein